MDSRILLSGKTFAVFVLAGLLFVSAAYAQADSPPTEQREAQPSSVFLKASGPDTEMTTETVTTTFRVRVNQVLVRVVVRDERGKVIPNLRKEDFGILDDGKPQAISAFFREHRESHFQTETSRPNSVNSDHSGDTQVHSALKGRKIACVIDDVHIDWPDLQRVVAALKAQLPNVLGPDTQLAVITTSGQVNLGFTNDSSKLNDALSRIKPHSLRVLEDVQCPFMNYYLADLIKNKNDNDALRYSISDTIRCMHIEDSPNAALVAEQAVRAAVLSELSTGDQETRVSLGVVRDAVGQLAVSLGERFIVLISPGFHLVDQHFEFDSLLERAGRSGVIINTLDPRGLYADPANEATTRGMTMIGESNYRMASAVDRDDVIGAIAAGTGGVWFHNNNDLGEGLRRTSELPECYYQLAFTPQHLIENGLFHKLKVTVAAPGNYNIVARRGYYAPNRLSNAKEADREEVEDALFSSEDTLEIPISVQTQYFNSGEQDAKLSVISKVDISRIGFRNEADRNVNKLLLLVGIFDQYGQFVMGDEKLINLRLRSETLNGMLRTGISIRSNFNVRSGRYLVRAVVRDAEGKQLSVKSSRVEIP